MYQQIYCIHTLHVHEGCEFKTKDSMYIKYTSQFSELFHLEKNVLYTKVNMSKLC